MMTLADWLHPLGTTSLSAFWLPLVFWTAMAGPALLLLHRWAAAHPLVHYRARQALLLALPLGLGLTALVDLSLLAARSGASPASGGVVVLSLPAVATASASSAPAFSWDVYHTLGLLTVLAAGLALWRLTRLALHAAALMCFKRGLAGTAREDVQAVADDLAAQMGVRRPVRVAVTPGDVTPMTFGGRHPVIVLPARLADDRERLRLALMHELVHIRRLDYAAQWGEQIVAAVFFVHPLVALLRHSAADYRERSCDAAVLDRSPVSRTRYADLLFDLAQPDRTPAFAAVGITEHANNLKQRIHAMRRYTPTSRSTKPTVIGLTCLLLITSMAVMACSDMVDTSETDENVTGKQIQATEVFQSVENMPELLPDEQTGRIQLAECINYPNEAEDAGIEGTVVVQFVVDEQGNITEPSVREGTSQNGGLDEEALRCVKKLRFEPGTQRGQPVKVRYTIPVQFSLSGGGSVAPEPSEATSKPALEAGVFQSVENMPELLPNEQAGRRQLAECISYPDKAERAGAEGTVIVQFIIDEQGNVTQPSVKEETSKGSGLDAEAIRCVKQLTFEPGTQRGRPAKVRYNIPVRFNLPDGGSASSDADAADNVAPVSRNVALRIRADGTVQLDGETVALAALEENLHPLVDKNSVVALEVEDQTAMSTVEKVQDAIVTAGAQKINHAAKSP